MVKATTSITTYGPTFQSNEATKDRKYIDPLIRVIITRTPNSISTAVMLLSTFDGAPVYLCVYRRSPHSRSF